MTKEQYRAGLEKMLSGSKAERIFLAENSFGLFCIYYYSDYFKYYLADYHYELIQDCEDLIAGKIREVVWIIYREGGKTTFEKLFQVVVEQTYAQGREQGKNDAVGLLMKNFTRIIFDLK